MGKNFAADSWLTIPLAEAASLFLKLWRNLHVDLYANLWKNRTGRKTNNPATTEHYTIKPASHEGLYLYNPWSMLAQTIFSNDGVQTSSSPHAAFFNTSLSLLLWGFSQPLTWIFLIAIANFYFCPIHTKQVGLSSFKQIFFIYLETALSFLRLLFLMLSKTNSFFFVPYRPCFQSSGHHHHCDLDSFLQFSLKSKHWVWGFLCKSSPTAEQIHVSCRYSCSINSLWWYLFIYFFARGSQSDSS